MADVKTIGGRTFEDTDVLEFLLNFKFLARPDSFVISGHQAPPRVTLARFLSICHGIEADLRALAVECRRKIPSVKSLAERATLKIGDYTDRREFAFRSGSDLADFNILQSSGSTPSSPSSPSPPTGDMSVFPTWDVLAVLWGVTHEITASTSASTSGSSNVQLHKALLLGLSTLQRTLGLWQQQQQSLRFRQRKGETSEKLSFDEDVFLDREQLNVVLRFLTDYVDTVDTERTSQASRATGSSPVVLSIQPSSSESEGIQLKVLQIILSLFSIDTPLFTPYYLGCNDSSMSSIILGAISRMIKFVKMLTYMHKQSTFLSVRRTAFAGLSQLVRFLLDSCTAIMIGNSSHLSFKGSDDIGNVKIDSDEGPLLYITYRFIKDLCEAINGQGKRSELNKFFSPLLALDLLIGGVGTVPNCFDMHPLMFQLLNGLEDVIQKTLHDAEATFPITLRTCSLLQCYWKHLSILSANGEDTPLSSDDEHEDDAEQRDSIAVVCNRGLQHLFSSVLHVLNSPNIPYWKQLIGLQFFRSILFQTGSNLPSDIIISLAEALSKSIHEVCFAIGDNITDVLSSTSATVATEFHKRPALSVPEIERRHIQLNASNYRQHGTHSNGFSKVIYTAYPTISLLSPRSSNIKHSSSGMASQMLISDTFVPECVATSITKKNPENVSRNNDTAAVQEMHDGASRKSTNNNSFVAKTQIHMTTQTTIDSNTASLMIRIALDATMQIIENLLLQLFTVCLYDEIAVLLEDNTVSLEHIIDGAPIPPIMLNMQTGKLFFLRLPFPLTREQAKLHDTLSSLWGSTVAALSLLLLLAPTPTTTVSSSSITQCALQCFLSLLTVSAMLSVQRCFTSCIRTLSQACIATSNGVLSSTFNTDEASKRSQPTVDLSLENEFCNGNGISFWRRQKKLSASVKRSKNSAQEQSVPGHFSESRGVLLFTQSACLKTLACAIYHYNASLNVESWSYVVRLFEALHNSNIFMVTPSSAHIRLAASEYVSEKADEIETFWGFLDYAFEAIVERRREKQQLGSSNTLREISPKSLTYENECGTASKEMMCVSGHIILTSFLEDSKNFPLSEESLLNFLQQLSLLLDGTVSKSCTENASTLVYWIKLLSGIEYLPETSLTNNSSSLDLYTKCNLLAKQHSTHDDSSLQADVAEHSSQILEQSLRSVLEIFYRVVSRNITRFKNQPHAVAQVASFLSSIIENPNSSPLVQVEIVSLTCRISSKLINALGEEQESVEDDIRGNGLAQAILLGHLTDIILHDIPIKAKNQVLETLANILKGGGSRLRYALPWSIVSVILGVFAQLHLLEFYSITIGEESTTGTEQRRIVDSGNVAGDTAVKLFEIIDIVVHEYCDRFRHTSCFSLLAYVLSGLVKSHACENNMSFAAVGLLWTLAESLTKRQSTEIDSLIEPSYIKAYGYVLPSEFDVVLSPHGAKVTLLLNQPQNKDDACIQGDVNTVIIKIFEEFRALASDVRVDVRNCSLRSLSSAYLTTISAGKTGLRNAVKNRVGLILVNALQDISVIYKSLLEGDEHYGNKKSLLPQGLHHHSRDSFIKLWDESLTIVLEGVFEVLSDVAHSVGIDTESRTSKPEEQLLISAGLTLVNMLTLLLSNCPAADPPVMSLESSKKNEVSLEVYLVAIRIVAKLCLIPGSCTLIHSPPTSLWIACWNIFAVLVDTLWEMDRLPDRISEALNSAVIQISPCIFQRQSDGTPCNNEFYTFVHLLLLLSIMGSRLHPAEFVAPMTVSDSPSPPATLSPPSRYAESPTEKSKEDSIANDQVSCTLSTRVEALKHVLVHGLLTGSTIGTAIELLSNTEYSTDFASNTDARWKEKFDRLLSTASPSSIPRKPLTSELFVRNDDVFCKQDVSVSSLFPAVLFPRGTHMMGPRPSSRPTRSSGPVSTFDDDYSSQPEWLDDSVIHKNSIKACMRLHRLHIPTKRLHSNDVVAIATLEGFLPWELCFNSDPFLWLKSIRQIIEAVLNPHRVYYHQTQMLIASRAINALTRIMRKTIAYSYESQLRTTTHLKSIGVAFYWITSRLLVLLKARPDLIGMGFYMYLSESILQLLADVTVVVGFAQDRDSDMSLDVLYASIAVVLDTFQKSWEAGIRKTTYCIGISAKRSPETLDWLLLYTTRILLGVDSTACQSHKPIPIPMLPLPLFDSVTAILNRFAIIGTRYGMLELSRTSLETLFDICKSLSIKVDGQVILTAQLQRATNITFDLVRVLLNRFIEDDMQSGQCPLPLQRLEEVGFILERLRSLELPPEAILSKTNVSEKLRAAANLAGTRSHIMLLLPDLLKLIVAKDGSVRKELKNVLEEGTLHIYSDSPTTSHEHNNFCLPKTNFHSPTWNQS